jgi:hypothetical protein
MTRPHAIDTLLPHLASLEEGFGSAYERYAVGRFTEQLVQELGIKSVAEWPANGVLGVPGLKSLPLALAGCDVTLLSPSLDLLESAASIWRSAAGLEPYQLVADPEEERAARPDAFDLVWSFCAFEHARDCDALARAMVRASRRYVLVFVQNAWSPGVHLHRLQHRVQRRRWDHGKIATMRAEVVEKHLQRAGAATIMLGGCDLPPWPDINVQLPRPGRARRQTLAAPRAYGPADPALTPEEAAAVFAKPAALSTFMRVLAAWHDAVETHLPRSLLRFVAHHPYVLVEKH